MRIHLPAHFLISLLLSGCAFQGVVVEKRSRPCPDSSMIGTEGVHSFAFRGPTGTSRLPITVPNPQFWTETNGRYTFMLRDRQGIVHSQMVTAEVFARYGVGDYFNDALPPAEATNSKDAKDTATKLVAHRRHFPKHQHQMAQAHRTHHHKVAKHHHRKKPRAIARHVSHPASRG